MGNKNSTKKTADKCYDLNGMDIDIPFRNNMIQLYRFEAPIMKNDLQNAMLRVLYIKTNKTLMKKKVVINVKNTKSIAQELSILLHLDHKNIMKIYQYFQSPHHYNIDYHYFDGTNIIDYFINKDSCVSTKDARYIIKTSLEVLNYLRLNNIVLRNFDPNNLLYDGKELMLVGFGKAKFYKPKNRKRAKFANNYSFPLYKAPEVIRGSYDEKAEVWVVGVILHLFLLGSLPFAEKNRDKLNKLIMTAPLNEKLIQSKQLDKDALDLLRGLLEKDPCKRLSAEQALKNPWLTSNEEQLDVSNVSQIFKHVKDMSNKLDFIDEIMGYVVKKSFMDKEYENLRKLFNKIDVNKDGMVTKQEFLSSIDSLNILISHNEVDLIFAKYDKNKTNTLEINEFIAALSDRDVLLNKERLTEYYYYVEDDVKKKVEIDKINQIVGKTMDAALVSKLFHKYAQRDKALDKDKFIAFMEELIQNYQKSKK